MSKSVRHARRSIQRGFTQVPNVVLLDPDLSMGAKFTYALMEHFAWASEDEWPGQDELAKRMGISKRSLGTYITELRAGTANCGILLETQRRGQGKSNFYVVHDPDPERQNLPFKSGNDCSSRSADFAEPNSEEKTEGEVEAADAASTSPSTTEDTARGNVVKFRGRKVPLDVYCTGVALLDSFNAKARTGYSPLTAAGLPSENLKRIFGAIIDHPEISLEIGERMIALAFAKPFWQGTPQTGVVFGPGVCEGHLEAAIHAATRPASGQSLIERLDARRAA